MPERMRYTERELAEIKLSRLTATKIQRRMHGWVEIFYHDTCVVKFSTMSEPLRFIFLDHGGFKTATTVRRMNQVAQVFDLPYRVFRKKKELWVASRRPDGSYNFDEPFQFGLSKVDLSVKHDQVILINRG